MNTAVLISGQMRSWSQCLPTLQWHLFRKLENPTFFISCADDEQARDAYLIEGLYKNVHIEIVKQPTLPEPPARLADHAGYAISSPIQAIMRQFWHLNRVWEFAIEKGPSRLIASENRSELDFGMIIRCRPDLWMQRFEMPRVVTYYDAHCPWWGRYSGVNDRLAILGATSAYHYFTAWNKLNAMLESGAPLHPETLLHEAMQLGSVKIWNTLRADFCTRRMTGEMVWPVVLPSDTVDFMAATRL